MAAVRPYCLRVAPPHKAWGGRGVVLAVLKSRASQLVHPSCPSSAQHRTIVTPALNTPITRKPHRSFPGPLPWRVVWTPLRSPNHRGPQNTCGGPGPQTSDPKRCSRFGASPNAHVTHPENILRLHQLVSWHPALATQRAIFWGGTMKGLFVGWGGAHFMYRCQGVRNMKSEST